MDLIVYDFEVFKHDWLVVWVNLTTHADGVIVNDAVELRNFYDEHCDDLWIGFNSKGYDTYILKGILKGFDPYDISDWIVGQGRNGWEFNREINYVPLYGYDVYLGITDRSLKELESFMGVSIHESSIPFDIDRKLTEEEIQETISYCKDDVKNTCEVFKRRIDIFNSYVNLIREYNLTPKSFKNSRAQLSAEILQAKRIEPPYRDEFNYIIPKCLKLGKYDYVREWYLNPENHDYKKELIVKTKTCDVKCAFGGLHDTLPPMKEEGIILACDVASYYPNLIRQYGLMSRAVPYPEMYNNIITERVKLKKTNKPLADSLKIVLNSTYGMMKDPTSQANDRRMANSVCISGQLLLLDLIEKVENHCKLLNVNTDGIYVKCETREDADKIKELAVEWQQRSGMGLEFDEYVKYISKDVNSYFLIDANGHTKSKGMVKELSELDYNLAIVNKGLKAVLVDGMTPEEYVESNDNFMDYMMTVKLKGDFKQIVHIEQGESVLIPNKVIRVFASSDRADGMIGRAREKKSKQASLFIDDDGGWNKDFSTQGINKFADTPDHCFIENGDIRGKKCPEKLDKSWYVDLIKNKLKFWEVR